MARWSAKDPRLSSKEKAMSRLWVPDGWSWRVLDPDGDTVEYSTEPIKLTASTEDFVDTGEGLLIIEADPQIQLALF
jgi:hypothetical protein